MKLTCPVVKTYPGFGDVLIMPRRNNVRIILRRDGSRGFKASVPYGSDFTSTVDIISKMLPRLEAKSPAAAQLKFIPGQVIDFTDGKITIDRSCSTRSPRHIAVSAQKSDIQIGLGAEVDCDQRETTEIISTLIKKALVHIAPPILIPRARQVAASLGVGPDHWKVGRGVSTLGTYYPADNHITLSGLLLLLPQDLRDFIVCHELAHITHRDHSPAFHRLCNSYCQGAEKELQKKLRNWQWPILR